MHITLEAITSWARKATGDIPEPMVGPSTTLVTIPHPTPTSPGQTKTHIWVYGGRSVRTRRVSSGLWCLDTETFVWEKVGPGEDSGEAWPRGRYFHTADRWRNKLVVFGGMGLSAPGPSSSPMDTPTSPDGSTISPSDEDPCVLNGVWVFDCITRRWSRPEGANVGMNMEEGVLERVENLPLARYAHTSVVSGGRLVVTGGQDLKNDYIMQASILDLNRMVWEAPYGITDHRGSYRSVSVASRYTLEPQTTVSKDDYGNPLEALPYSVEAQDGDGDIYTFSNSNFTDVRRQIQSSRFDPDGRGLVTRDITVQMTSRSKDLPPGLRFPFASIIGSHLVIAGTYLSAHEQEYIIWALDLKKARWRKIDAMVLVSSGKGAIGGENESLGGGSWNKAVAWEEAGKLLVFGNKNRSLAEDYEQRAINFGHVAIVDLEVFGIYQPPVRDCSYSPRMIPFALKSLRESWSSDYHIVCEDGRALACSKEILKERWPWFKKGWEEACRKAKEVVDGMSTDSDFETPDGIGPRPITEDKVGTPLSNRWRSILKVQPQTLQLAEPYPVCKALLEYFYTHDLVTPLQHRAPILSALLILAKQYELDDLKRKVVYSMHERLSASNCLGIYEIASLCACTSLQVRALRLVLAMQKKESRGSTHRRGDSGAGLTPASARGAEGGQYHGNGSNGHAHQGSVGSHMLPSAGSANTGPQGYAMNLPPSSFRISKSPRTRSPSLSGASLKASPLPIPSDNIFTFPPKVARDADQGGSPSANPVSRSLRSTASQPILNVWKDERGADLAKPSGSSPAESPLLNGSSADEGQSDYDPPTYRGRPRTASLKSVHHYQNGLANARWSHNTDEYGAKLRSPEQKEHRPRSNALASAPKRKSISKSHSISSFFNMPSATSSITWIGQHLHTRSPSVQGPHISSPIHDVLEVTIGPETGSNYTLGTPDTSGSSANSQSSSLAWADPSDEMVFWQVKDQTKGNRHQRLCSLGGDDDKDKTPMPKRTLQVDTRLAQKQYKQTQAKRDAPDSRVSPRGEMPLFFVPPNQTRSVH